MKVKGLEPRYRLIISHSEGELIEKALKTFLTNGTTLSEYEKKLAQTIRLDLQCGIDFEKGEDENGN